jgi:hypothetical protein
MGLEHLRPRERRYQHVALWPSTPEALHPGGPFPDTWLPPENTDRG